jgi:surface-anchored protein
MNDTTYVELVSVDGPGNFFVYNTDSFGVPSVGIDSADGITSDDRLTVLAGSHGHVNWTFDAEGDYELAFVVKGTLLDGTSVESEPTTFNFEVGHHDDHGHDGHEPAPVYHYEEASNGDLSSDAANPTPIPIEGAGEYKITGQTVNYQGPNADPEYFTIEIPAGYEMTAIRMINWDQSDFLNGLPSIQLPFGNGGFFGIGEGSSLPVIASPDHFPVAANALFGGALVGITPGAAAGDDVMDDLQAGFNFDPIAIPGFSGNLGEGTYTFMLKEGFGDASTFENFTAFSLVFEVTPAHGELEAGHADIEVAYEEGELELHIHDEDTDMELEPGEVVLAVPEAAESAVPDGANFAFLGNVGDPLWILPQTAQSDVLFLGIAAGEVESGVFMNDTTYVELVSVDGPGNFFVYNTDSFGVPSVGIDSADGITSDDRLTVLAGSHGHVNWTFDAEGDYELAFVVKGTLLDSTSVESEPTTFNFEVGHHDDDEHETFEQWTLDNFGANPGDEASVDGNPDLDDLNNVLEFAFGTDPNTPDSTELVVTDAQTLTTGTPVLSTLTVGDGVNFTVRFVRRMDAESAGLTYNIQFSRDMSEWETTDQAPIMVATQGDYEVVEVDFPFAMSNGRKPQFFRVLAELSN